VCIIRATGRLKLTFAIDLLSYFITSSSVGVLLTFAAHLGLAGNFTPVQSFFAFSLEVKSHNVAYSTDRLSDQVTRTRRKPNIKSNRRTKNIIKSESKHIDQPQQYCTK